MTGVWKGGGTIFAARGKKASSMLTTHIIKYSGGNSVFAHMGGASHQYITRFIQ